MKKLLIDIENSPLLGYTWQTYEADVLKIVEESYLLSIAWKFTGENQTHVLGLPDFKTYKKNPKNDKELVQKAWELCNEADIIIAHNGDNFDLKKLNAYFIKHGLTPPAPYKTVDTLKVARNRFGFSSNKLDNIGKYLGIGQKAATGGINLWFQCMEGDEKAWRKMKSYNKQDVVLLEKVYLMLAPWMTIHPNINADSGIDGCPACGSENLQRRGYDFTQSGRRQRYQCNSCGKWCKGKSERTTTIS